MSIKTKYYELNEIKSLLTQVKLYDEHEEAVSIAESLNDWIETEKRGEYIINILAEQEIRFLNELDNEMLK